jgi:hypothetical protein
MSDEEKTNVQIAARITTEQHAAFFARAESLRMTASAVMRELVIGFLEGRVTIAPPPHLSDLYNTTKE